MTILFITFKNTFNITEAAFFRSSCALWGLSFPWGWHYLSSFLLGCIAANTWLLPNSCVNWKIKLCFIYTWWVLPNTGGKTWVVVLLHLGLAIHSCMQIKVHRILNLGFIEILVPWTLLPITLLWFSIFNHFVFDVKKRQNRSKRLLNIKDRLVINYVIEDVICLQITFFLIVKLSNRKYFVSD